MKNSLKKYLTMASVLVSILAGSKALATGPFPITDAEAESILSCANGACSSDTTTMKYVLYDIDKMETLLANYKKMGASKIGIHSGAIKSGSGAYGEAVVLFAHTQSSTGFQRIGGSGADHGELCSPPKYCSGCPDDPKCK